MSHHPPSVCGDALLISTPVPRLIILSAYYRYLPLGHSAHSFLTNPFVSQLVYRAEFKAVSLPENVFIGQIPKSENPRQSIHEPTLK